MGFISGMQEWFYICKSINVINHTSRINPHIHSPQNTQWRKDSLFKKLGKTEHIHRGIVVFNFYCYFNIGYMSKEAADPYALPVRVEKIKMGGKVVKQIVQSFLLTQKF